MPARLTQQQTAQPVQHTVVIGGVVIGLTTAYHLAREGETVADLLASRGDRITAFNGWDTLTFFGIAAGAEASVGGAAGIVPELAVELWEALAEQGDLARAREVWRHLWAISAFLESVNYVAGVKAGLDLIGHSAGPARLPIQPLPAEQRERFAGILRDAGVDVDAA